MYIGYIRSCVLHTLQKCSVAAAMYVLVIDVRTMRNIGTSKHGTAHSQQKAQFILRTPPATKVNVLIRIVALTPHAARLTPRFFQLKLFLICVFRLEMPNIQLMRSKHEYTHPLSILTYCYFTSTILYRILRPS